MRETSLKVPVTLDDVEIELARRSVMDFTTYTKPDYETGWHHRFLCEKIDRFVRGEIPRLMVFMPPRHGKSEIVSRRLPAYIFGHRPSTSIISCSYGSDLASRMNRDVQRIIDSERYRKVFPKTRLWGKNVRSTAESSWLRNSDIFEVVNHGGVYRSAGVGGAITGMGAEFAIIDDPIKNQEEAYSPVYREKVWEWYGSTLYTRLEKQASLLITLTRWHEDDLAGRLLEQMRNDPSSDRWEVINFPAIREDLGNPDDPRAVGEALWPEKFPLTRLRSIQSQGSRVWNALYQQRPAPEQGEIIKADWWKRWQRPPERFDWILISWDTNFKGGDGSDYVVGQVWGRVGARKYLLDQVRQRFTFTETVQAMRAMNRKWAGATENVIELKANGHAIIDTLKDEIPSVVGFTPEVSKTARAIAISPQVEAGNVYIPDETLYPWVKDFLTEWQYFPNGKNDDQVDATTQALARMDEARFPWAEITRVGTSAADPTSGGLAPSVKDMFWKGS